MQLRQLEIFRAVIAAGTTTGAALSLGISQPAVSRTIANAEHALGLQLFERDRGRLIPTDEADRLYKEVEPLFMALEAAQARIRDIRDGKTGSIRIVATPSLATSIIPPAINAIVADTPGVRVSLDVRRWENLADQVESNTAGYWPSSHRARAADADLQAALRGPNGLRAAKGAPPAARAGDPAGSP